MLYSTMGAIQRSLEGPELRSVSDDFKFVLVN